VGRNDWGNTDYSPGTAPRGYQSGVTEALDKLRALVRENTDEQRGRAYQQLERTDPAAFRALETFANQFDDPDYAVANLLGTGESDLDRETAQGDVAGEGIRIFGT